MLWISPYQSTKVGGEIDNEEGKVEGMPDEKALTFSLPAKMLARYQLSVESREPLIASAKLSRRRG